jgi:hypothetical protein
MRVGTVLKRDGKYRSVVTTASKEWRCDECFKEINKDEKYVKKELRNVVLLRLHIECELKNAN